jgi:hypothetical protein
MNFGAIILGLKSSSGPDKMAAADWISREANDFRPDHHEFVPPQPGYIGPGPDQSQENC